MDMIIDMMMINTSQGTSQRDSTSDYINYNHFFHPNLCHVCKRNNGDLITCECHLVSYCCIEHKSAHKKQHESFCNYISNYFNLKYSTEWMSLRSTAPEWIKSRQEILRDLKIARELQPYEEQMIIFAKSCHICHQQTDLHLCQTCYSDNYCNEHAQEFQSQHESKCLLLKIYLNLKITSHMCNKFTVTCHHLPYNINTDLTDMDDFITTYVRKKNKTGIESLISFEYYYSDYISGPLTLYYGLKNANILYKSALTKSRCVIHVIAADPIEREYVIAWEILMHLSHHLRHLEIVLIGSKLEAVSNKFFPTCINCRLQRKQFTFESYHGSYDSYVKSWLVKEPDVIIAFEADFTNEKLCLRSLLHSGKRDSSFILTTVSQSIAEENINKMQEYYPGVKPIYNAENKFKSIKPWRDFKNGSIWYRNQHVTVYENLKPIIFKL